MAITYSSKRSKHRVQFDFAQNHFDRLEYLVEKLGASSRAEVVKNALKLLQEIVEAEDRNASVLLREEDGREVRLVRIS